MYNNNFNQKNNKPKSVKVTLKLNPTGKTPVGNYDINSFYAIMEDISKVFSILSVPVTCGRNLLTGDKEAKGTKTVGRILSWDPVDNIVDVLIFGNDVQITERYELCVVPKVRTAKNSENVTCVNGFELTFA